MVLHAGVKGVSERSELTPCIFIVTQGASGSGPGLSQGGAIAITFFVTLMATALIIALVMDLLIWTLCIKRN